MKAKLDSRRTPLLRTALLWILPVLSLLGLYTWYVLASRYVTTDNAYVRAGVSEIAPEISGTVAHRLVEENQPVVQGQPILELRDPALDIAVAHAEADLATARTTISTLRANYAEKRSELTLARDEAAFAAREFARLEGLASQGLVARVSLDAAAHALTQARGRVEVLRRELGVVLASLDGKAEASVDEHPEVMAAMAALERAHLDVARRIVNSPVNGVVSHLPEPGDRLQAGRPAFAVVSAEGHWVEANFKETDLEFVRPGLPVKVRVDAYPGATWQGTVESISQATGSEFALLPAQNATGNWVKVVQRIAVRVSLTPVSAPHLRVGMSARVWIDTGHIDFPPAWLRRG